MEPLQDPVLINEDEESPKEDIKQLGNGLYIQEGENKKLISLKWTEQEDNQLIQLVKHFGEKNWAFIAKYIEKHSPHQCSERYKELKENKLKAKIVSTPIAKDFTREEDVLLWRKVQEFGKNWCFISAFFKDRTELALKNRYSVLVRRTKRLADELTPNNINLGAGILEVVLNKGDMPPF